MFGDIQGPGEFYNNGSGGEFALPQFRMFRSCTVLIDININTRDTSSWTTIQHVASMISPICSNGQYPSGVTGGVAHVGKAGRNRVFVGRLDSMTSNTKENGKIQID